MCAIVFVFDLRLANGKRVGVLIRYNLSAAISVQTITHTNTSPKSRFGIVTANLRQQHNVITLYDHDFVPVRGLATTQKLNLKPCTH